jgi:ABC-2 type transport system ATP-binding protein
VARIGAVFGQRTQLWWDLPVIESFELLRDIYRVPAARYRKTRDELVALLGLDRLLATPVRQLSLGQRMRCEIAASMLHEPRVLFLDEPTIGLDAVAKLAVRRFVKTLHRERGVTVILTTHDMHDVEALAERVIVIGKGVILADGSVDALRRGALAERRLRVRFACDVDAVDVPGATVRRRAGRSVELSFDPRTTPAHRLIAQVTASFEVEDVHLEDPPIEEVIAHFYALHAVEG